MVIINIIDQFGCLSASGFIWVKTVVISSKEGFYALSLVLFLKSLGHSNRTFRRYNYCEAEVLGFLISSLVSPGSETWDQDQVREQRTRSTVDQSRSLPWIGLRSGHIQFLTGGILNQVRWYSKTRRGGRQKDCLTGREGGSGGGGRGVGDTGESHEGN